LLFACKAEFNFFAELCLQPDWPIGQIAASALAVAGSLAGLMYAGSLLPGVLWNCECGIP